MSVEYGHRNSGFTHWKSWIFPSFFVCLPVSPTATAPPRSKYSSSELSLDCRCTLRCGRPRALCALCGVRGVAPSLTLGWIIRRVQRRAAKSWRCNGLSVGFDGFWSGEMRVMFHGDGQFGVSSHVPHFYVVAGVGDNPPQREEHGVQTNVIFQITWKSWYLGGICQLIMYILRTWYIYIYIHRYEWKIMFGEYFEVPQHVVLQIIQKIKIRPFWKLDTHGALGIPHLEKPPYDEFISWYYAKNDSGSSFSHVVMGSSMGLYQYTTKIRQHSWGLASLLVAVHRHGILPFYLFGTVIMIITLSCWIVKLSPDK